MTEENTKAKAPAKAAEKKAARPRLTAEQKIEQLKEQAAALETKVKERKLSSFSKDLQRYTSMLDKMAKLHASAAELLNQLDEIKEENNIDTEIPEPTLTEIGSDVDGSGFQVSLFDSNYLVEWPGAAAKA